MIQISDLVAYAIILWVGGIVLVTFGWREGRKFWPPVLHLIFMLPLPEVLYYGLSTYLQGVSSQLGVYFLHLLQVPVLLDGNIIDLGVYKLQVAEACSGLRYLFPILSFSYFFSVLYRGPYWHKLILLLAAGPLTVLMNSVRIAIAGAVVDQFGTEFVEGLSHFLEGWVIFVVCILILFLLARILLIFQPTRMGLIQALDLEIDGIWQQGARLRLLKPTSALIGLAIVVSVAALVWQVTPARPLAVVDRQPFALFPSTLGEWTAGPPQRLDPATAKVLAADDYYASALTRSGTAQPVDLFVAWYKDQVDGGTHSPTVCLPSAGWEIASLDEVNASGGTGGAQPFTVNRAVIQKGLDQMLVYYWYDQQGQRTASSYYAKVLLTWTKVMSGRSDGALVRLITPIADGEPIAAAESRLKSALRDVIVPLPRFVPGA
jgi:exosortase D (VPLPA-CTERM-specific)